MYPVYIPYKIQHLVLTRAQRLLEECCYDFTVQWLPELLGQRRWDCPEAIELNKWTHIVVRRLDSLRHCSQAFANDSTLSLAHVLTSVNKLRHSAVHRLPTTAKGISEMISSVTRFARVLRDSAREQQLDELHRELESKMRALELNKNFLETKLEQELQKIAKQRRELDEKEKGAVVTMLREDEDHGSFIGVLLLNSVKQIFDKSENKEPEGTEPERSSDHETEEEEEQEHAVKYDRVHQGELGLPIEAKALSHHGTESEKHGSKPDHQSLVNAEERVQPSARPSVGRETNPHNEHELHVGRDLLSESRQPSTLHPQQIPTRVPEPTDQSPAMLDKIGGRKAEATE